MNIEAPLFDYKAVEAGCTVSLEVSCCPFVVASVKISYNIVEKCCKINSNPHIYIFTEAYLLFSGSTSWKIPAGKPFLSSHAGHFNGFVSAALK